MCYSFKFVESYASLILLQKLLQDLFAKHGWFMILFFVFCCFHYYFFDRILFLIILFRALILKSTSRSLGPLHNYSNIFFFIGFIFTINYAKIYTILVNLFILYQKKKEFVCSPSMSHTITWNFRFRSQDSQLLAIVNLV